MPDMNIEESRQLLSEHFNRPVEEVDTEELEQLYDDVIMESKQVQYTGIHEELLRALNFELMNRRGS